MQNAIDLKTDTQMVWRGGSVQVRISTSRELGWPLQGRSPLDAEAMQKGFGRRPQDVSENLVHLTMWYHRPTSAACLMLQYGLDLHRDVVNPARRAPFAKIRMGKDIRWSTPSLGRCSARGSSPHTAARRLGLVGRSIGATKPAAYGRDTWWTSREFHRPASPTSVPTTGVPRSITPAAIFLRARSGHEPVYWTDAIMPPILRLEIASRSIKSYRRFHAASGERERLHLSSDGNRHAGQNLTRIGMLHVFCRYVSFASTVILATTLLSPAIQAAEAIVTFPLGRNAYFIGECVPLAFRSAAGPMILEVVGKREITEIYRGPAQPLFLDTARLAPGEYQLKLNSQFTGDKFTLTSVIRPTPDHCRMKPSLTPRGVPKRCASRASARVLRLGRLFRPSARPRNDGLQWRTASG